MLNILLIEDEFIISRDVKIILEKEAFSSLQLARDYKTASEILNFKDIDLIISDINLNLEIDGIEIVSRLLKIKKVPVVYLTAYSDEDIIKKAEKTSPFAYILKPYNENQLKLTINLACLNFEKTNSNIEINTKNTELLKLLTKREKEILVVLASGKISKEIADTLNISAQTVEKHKQNIRIKLNLRTIGEMVNFTMTSKLLELNAN